MQDDHGTAQRPLVMIVDDDPVVAHVLHDAVNGEFNVCAVTSAAAALAALEEQPVCVILADQRMPGMGGVELLAQAHLHKPTIVGVLMTAHADLDSAISAINTAHVQGFLTKPWDEKELFATLHRAVGAHRALEQLRHVATASERELASFDRFVRADPVPVTAQHFGQGPLRELSPDDFAQLVSEYSRILVDALDERVYRVDHHVSAGLRSLAQRIGDLRGGPRDVIDLHVSAFKERVTDSSPAAGPELVDTGRLLVLELMGEVASYYRSYTLGLRR